MASTAQWTWQGHLWADSITKLTVDNAFFAVEAYLPRYCGVASPYPPPTPPKPKTQTQTQPAMLPLGSTSSNLYRVW